jgi:prevent-host-death family protein
MNRVIKKKPQLIMKNGKPDAVIINIKDYYNMLDRLDDKEDLADLERMRKGHLKFRKLDDFLSEYKP